MAANSRNRVKKVFRNVARLFGGRFTFSKPADKPIDPSKITTLTTGFRPLDKATGIGGLPCGKISELIAPSHDAPGDGINNIAAYMGAKLQKKQRLVTIVDMTRQFDTWQAQRCGLIAPQMLLHQPDTVLEMLTIIETAAENDGLIIIIMGIVSEALGEADTEGLRLLTRRFEAIVQKAPGSALLFLTVPTEDSPFYPSNYPDGFPLAQLADVRLWVQDETWSYQDNVATSYKASLAVIKNELALAGMGADIRIKLAPVLP